MTDWDTPVSANRSIFIPSGLRNAAPSLESSLIIQIGISSQPREHAFVQGAGRREDSHLPTYLSVGDNTPPVAPVARIQVNTRGIGQRQLCWDAASNTTVVQLQIPGTSVVVATRCIERGVVLRDSVSPAHTGSKRKGGALQQGMGAAIQEKEDARVTH